MSPVFSTLIVYVIVSPVFTFSLSAIFAIVKFDLFAFKFAVATIGANCVGPQPTVNVSQGFIIVSSLSVTYSWFGTSPVVAVVVVWLFCVDWVFVVCSWFSCCSSVVCCSPVWFWFVSSCSLFDGVVVCSPLWFSIGASPCCSSCIVVLPSPAACACALPLVKKYTPVAVPAKSTVITAAIMMVLLLL